LVCITRIILAQPSHREVFEVGNDAIKEALESFVPENNRSQIVSKGTNQIILDAYNANPSSMAVAIENFYN
jgi:UDP-N-acetylmuramoyl-tripeptide--D-alanyl-D-alanine ligase